MARVSIFISAALLFPLGAALAQEPANSSPAADGFSPLYNGTDLSGWEVRGGKLSAWQADGELLSCTGEGGGWLQTAKTYSDFVLNLEYRIPPRGNSGVGLRIPPHGNPAHAGMEIQILDDDADEHKQLAPAQYTGGVYYQAAPRRGAALPPGEWNSFEITCRGPLVKVVLNGEAVNDISVDKFTTGEGGHPPLSERPEIGRIALQSHGSRVDFRNIRVKDLTSSTKSGARFVDLAEGKGTVVSTGAAVIVRFTGRLSDGTRFDSNREKPAPDAFSLKEVIVGWQEGLPGMKVGGRRKLIIPPELGYGSRAVAKVPANSMLIFDVEVLEVR